MKKVRLWIILSSWIHTYNCSKTLWTDHIFCFQCTKGNWQSTTVFPRIVAAEGIEGGNYSREETIRGNTYSFFELAILDFFFPKNIFFAWSPLKSVTNYVTEWMGFNFDVFPGFQQISCLMGNISLYSVFN